MLEGNKQQLNMLLARYSMSRSFVISSNPQEVYDMITNNYSAWHYLLQIKK